MRAILAWLLGGLALAAAPAALGGAGLHTTIDVATADAATLQTTISVAVGGASPPPPPSAANTMTISDAGGAGIAANYPLQFGRPFIAGAVPAGQCPVVTIAGDPVATQADVKNSYPDGSVKFAVIAVNLPAVAANGRVQLGFIAGPCNNAPLSRAQMLATNFDFDAAMTVAWPPMLVGGDGSRLAINTTLANLTPITNGALALTVNGNPVTVSGMNFSQVGSWNADVWNVLKAAFQPYGVAVLLEGNPIGGTARFSLTVPGGRSISLASTPACAAASPATCTDVSGTFGFTAAQGAEILAPSSSTASARAMLAAGDYKLWTSGPIAQTIMLGDDTAARKYDIGDGDGVHPFRPRFFATFWPTTNQVAVRYVGENDLTTEVEDLAYSVAATIGNSAPASAFALDLTGDQQKWHWALTDWTQQAWLGGAPTQQVNIDNNLAYLAATRFVPNYDPAVPLDPNTVANAYASFSGHPHGPYDGQWNGGYVWQNAMGEVGAREDIGPNPGWYVWWLYSGDWRMRQLALNAADTAGSFPLQARESDPSRRLSRADATGLNPSTGLGRTISITDRKTIVLRVPGYGDTKPADRLTFVGPFSQPLWSSDGAHQPDAYFLPYLLTGDPWYLQEMYLWAGFSAARYNGADTNATDGRGPTGDEGGIADELRGAGWVLRNRAETAFIAPDADPEKGYFTYLTNDALGRWEGGFRIAGTALDGEPDKVWGTSLGNAYSDNGGNYGRQPPALHNWESNGNPSFDNSEIDAQVAGGVFQSGKIGSWTAPFMQHYVQYCLGRAAELGFAAKPLQEWTGVFAIGEVTGNSAPEAVIEAYEAPVESYAPSNPLGNTPAGGFFAWAQLLADAYTPNWVTTAGPAAFANALENPQSYPTYTLGGMAMLVDEGVAGAPAAWGWLDANIRTKVPWSSDPSWAIVPRTDTNLLPAMPTTAPPS